MSINHCPSKLRFARSEIKATTLSWLHSQDLQDLARGAIEYLLLELNVALGKPVDELSRPD